jgi:hypothetical protein
MKAQQPAEGILLKRNYGDAISYKVECECGQDWHSHDVWIEAEEVGVTVHTYVALKTDYWSQAVDPALADSIWAQEFFGTLVGLVNGLLRRVKLTWAVWTQGYVGYEGCVTMTAQQALNYSDSLARAVNDVTLFRNGRKAIIENREATRAAQQGDCV